MYQEINTLHLNSIICLFHNYSRKKKYIIEFSAEDDQLKTFFKMLGKKSLAIFFC